MHRLRSHWALRPVKAGGAWGSDQAMALRRHLNLNFQMVAAHQPPWWMNQNVMANGRTFWVQALKQTQRPFMLMEH